MATRVLIVLGTRPEAIKLCPVILALRGQPAAFVTHACSTGQHRELLEPVWTTFQLSPDSRLNLMVEGQSLSSSASRILAGLSPVLEDFQPDLLLVQGDTTTTLCGALSGFYHHVPVGHVEAGLRSGDPAAPFPEEMNRRLVSQIAALHFAPTAHAVESLRHEGIPPERVHLTGNTGIDALRLACNGLDQGAVEPIVRFPSTGRRRVVVTMHRREALETGLPSVCAALLRIAENLDTDVVFPLHPNPAVRAVIDRELRPHPHIHRCPPLDYLSFVALLRDAAVVVTDSGGIQEEAPYLGVPVVVVREKTERIEGVQAGIARLAGFDTDAIVSACREALFLPAGREAWGGNHAIYGDGTAAIRIRTLISSFFNR